MNETPYLIDRWLLSQVELIHRVYPIQRISSTYRNETYNASIGGAKASKHLHGLAIDVVFEDTKALLPAAFLAIKYGIQGVEVDFNNWHLHVDVRETPWHEVRKGRKRYRLEEYLTLESLKSSI